MEKRNSRKYSRYSPSWHGHWARPMRGLKLVHIGDDVWCVGKISEKVIRKFKKVKSGEDNPVVSVVEHQVIYGPDRKEYHLGNKEIEKIRGEQPYNKSGVNNPTDQAKLKVYILTSILDDRDNWCFDLECKPKSNTKVKVIYSNGTVRNILFTGEFTEEKIDYAVVKPIGYRIKK